MRTGRSPADVGVRVCVGVYRCGLFGGARTDARGAQSGGVGGVCAPWHVPVGAFGGARTDARGSQSGGFGVSVRHGMYRRACFRQARTDARGAQVPRISGCLCQ